MRAFLLAAAILACTGLGLHAEPVHYAPTAAKDALDAACAQAQKESKLIFLKSGNPECGWCTIFDRYHAMPEVQAILGKYYVFLALDCENMPDGAAVFSKYAEPASPSWVILTPDRKVVATSYAPFGNVGYPGEPQETEYYLKTLKSATPALTQADLDRLGQLIAKADIDPEPSRGICRGGGFPLGWGAWTIRSRAWSTSCSNPTRRAAGSSTSMARRFRRRWRWRR